MTFSAGTVAFALRASATATALVFGAAEVKAGQSWLFAVRTNPSTGGGRLVGRVLAPDVACATVTNADARDAPGRIRVGECGLCPPEPIAGGAGPSEGPDTLVSRANHDVPGGAETQ